MSVPPSVLAGWPGRGPVHGDRGWLMLHSAPPARYALVRILGNDLPPRHGPDQSLRNLEYQLTHEPAFPGTLKLWLLNRLADPAREAALTGLLQNHGARWLRLPFSSRAMARAGAQSLQGYALCDELQNPAQRQRHLRCLYAMNVNGARNSAIAWGRKRARWTLPLDGQCYFDPAAWATLVQELEQDGDPGRCYALPMQRLHALPPPGTLPRPAADEEPQVIFGWRCPHRFDPLYRYGRLSKVELLRRLGLERRRQDASRLPDSRHCRGYVFRLPSGSALPEGHWRERRAAREAGIDTFLHDLALAGTAHR